MKNRLRPPSTRSVASRFFVEILTDTKRLAFPRSVSKQIWDLFEASDDPEAHAFIYTTSSLVASFAKEDKPTSDALCESYFVEWLTPDLLVGALGELITREELSPALGARLQARIERWSSAEGRWLW